jgi:RNA polymerase sigma factor (sigma-70 family)
MHILTNIKNKSISKREIKVKNNDLIRFSKDYEQYFDLVFNQFYASISNVELAEEMSQELFITLMKKQDSVENTKKWLYGSIRNYLANYYRTKRNKPDIENIEDYYDSNALSFVNGFKDSSIIISECLSNIQYNDEIEENIFELIINYNYSFREVAETFKISRKKVTRIYKNIENQLLERLKKIGIKSYEDLL